MATEKLYRPYMTAILIMCRLASATYFMTPVFMLFTPDHHCKTSFSNAEQDYEHNGKQNYNSTDVRQLISSDMERCVQWNSSIATNSTGRFPCTNGWLFELSPGATTVVTEYSLVCDRAWIKPVLTALLMAGFMIGGLVCGSVSDGFGRKTALLVAMAGELVCPVTIALTHSVPVLGAMLFVSGLFFATLTVTSPVLLMELAPEKIRSTLVLVQVSAFSIGYAVLCPIAYLLPNWRHMLFGVAGFMLCCYLPVTVVPESEMWRKRKEEKKLAQDDSNSTNGNSRSEVVIGLTQDTEINPDVKIAEKATADKTNTYLDFLTVGFLFRRSSILVLAWTSCSFSHFGFNFNAGQLEGDRYLNSFLSTLLDLPGILMLHLIARKIGYIRGFAVQSALGGLTLLTMPLLSQYPPWASTVCALLGKVQIGAGFAALYAYTGTVFPTALRNQAYGVCAAVSRISVVVMPFVLFAGETFNTSLPYLVMSALMITSAAAVLFLPVTKDQPLPQTLSDAKAQHRLQWKLRCLLSKKDTTESKAKRDKSETLLPGNAGAISEA